MRWVVLMLALVALGCDPKPASPTVPPATTSATPVPPTPSASQPAQPSEESPTARRFAEEERLRKLPSREGFHQARIAFMRERMNRQKADGIEAADQWGYEQLAGKTAEQFVAEWRSKFPHASGPTGSSTREVLPGEPRIVHVRDWHLVPRDDFSVDTELTGSELETAYAEHVATVKAVQASQRKILEKVHEVYCEGLSEADYDTFQLMLSVQKEEPLESTLLHLGAAAQLMIEGKLTVLPCEGVEQAAANPLKSGGFKLDDAANEGREDAIVRNLIKGGKSATIVLGGAHDLSDNLKRLAPGWGYRVVTPRGYPN